jgi:mRNA interferase ChpB
LKQGDIYLVSLDPTEGRERRGSQPVLIVSATDFNIATKLPVICPITSGGEFARRIGCDQPRVLDLVSRNGRKVDTLPVSILDEVLAKLAPIFS